MTSPSPPTSPMAAPRDATPELLTPRSKIKALLATVESSDDETGPRSKTPSKTIPKHVSLSRHTLNNDGSDSDSDVEIRPRGKLASRMRGVTSTHTSEQQQPTGLDDVRSAGEEEANGGVELQAARSPSPGLFVSPTPSEVGDQDGSEDDLPDTRSERFKALVEKKVQARLAKEAEEEARQEKRRIEMEKLALEDEDDNEAEDDDDDDDGFGQQARPTRKAGKKAIEEMNRETQRMARNMQLAHEAKTRKVVTKENLFERFNYRPGGAATRIDAPNSLGMQASPKSSADRGRETPPSSPPADQRQGHEQATRTEATQAVVDIEMDDAEDDEFPTLDEVMASAAVRIDKGKGKMPAEPVATLKLTMHPKRRVRVRLPVSTTTRVDSDDELEVTATVKDKMKAVFDSVPLVRDVESQSIQALRALALVRSPGKEARRGKGKEREGMTPGELQAYLQQKARQQAKTEREKRLKMLKAQGVTIETAEERERQMQEVEDILAKAREEGERIGEEEKAAAKREKKESGEVDPLDWDNSSADEDYEEGDAGSAIELSGSEDDEDEDDNGNNDNDDDDDDENDNMQMDEEAPQVAHSDADADADVDDGDGEDLLPVLKQRRARKQVAVLSDDEDEDDDETIKATPETKTPAKTPAKASYTAPIPTSDPIAPGSVLRSAKKTFIPGLPVKGPAGLGLTQIFAGTMDDSQTSQTSRAPGPTQSMMPDFTQVPSPSFSRTNETSEMNEDEDEMAIDSQPQPIRFNAAHSHSHSPSQFPSTIDPTQDGGLQSQTPLARRYADLPSTMDTVATERLPITIPESPLVLKGRLRRKMDVRASVHDEQINTSSEVVEVDRPEPRPDIFSKMKAGARKQKLFAVDEFDKKKSKAKDMVEEQAAESEDEYAGLGGADGEDSDDDSDASVHEFLDDAAGNDVDERELAAFYADREVSNDQKAIEKLYKDITSGGLRKRRAADYDLSDSDDGGEARRRMKRRQFAKMQKALYADERVKKIAKDPGTQAFLRTIEDQGSDEEMMVTILGEASAMGSLSEETPSTKEASPAVEGHKEGPPGVSATAERRAPAHLRRTKDGKRPSNIGEIRETVSDLLDEQHETVIPATAPDADSDGERPVSDVSRTSNPVVDRMKKKTKAPAASSSRMAFAAGASASSASGASSSSFKVPSLLRRATTNSLGAGPSAAATRSTSGGGTNTGSSSSSSMTTHTSGGFGAEGKIRKGAGKKSGVRGFTRDLERNARVKEGERRREERKIRGAESRAGLVGGLLARGSFE